MSLRESEHSAEEAAKHLAGQASKGTRVLCHGEFSKASITRHLETCQQRIAADVKAGSRRKAQKTRIFHLVVGGRDLPIYLRRK